MPEKILATYTLNNQYDWAQIPNSNHRGIVLEIVDRCSGEHLLRCSTADIKTKIANLFCSYSGRRGAFSTERFQRSRISDIVVNLLALYPGELTGNQELDQQRVNEFYQTTFWPDTEEE